MRKNDDCLTSLQSLQTKSMLTFENLAGLLEQLQVFK